VNAQSDAARSVLAALDKFEQLLDLLQSELGIKAKHRTLSERLLGYWQMAAGASKTLWQYELFAIDDLVIADGKEVKTTRSVTVGKSIGAIAILVFGFMLISWLIRAVIGLAERRLGLKASAGTLIRRWLTVIATGTLIVLSFNLVQIPLSVFAFLGGALAIGVGFGTQNLLKNLISGVMLLIERPIRIGDLVEIDGVRGRVASIGIRFSTIHSSDGIDTLIPNSELVEKKLTNWTFSNPDVRREIRVGVAYGADPVQVKNLMQAAALEHSDVMQSPQPMVVLDDLGDNALIFTLRYWIRVQAGTDGRRVDSDLRCEILEKLKTAGIAVPYPQRDVHLTASGPLPVVLTQPEIKTH
jgi:small-conductance mechanosensitive channel